MTLTTIIIPHLSVDSTLIERLPTLASTLNKVVDAPEIIVIDAGGGKPCSDLLEVAARHHLRLGRLLPSGGLGAAISAGVLAARGERVLLIQPHLFAEFESQLEDVRQTLAKLNRADLVYCRRKRSGLQKAWHRVARIPRWLLLGLEVKDPVTGLWAARREAVMGLDLPRDMVRYLPDLVNARGYRVTEVLQSSPVTPQRIYGSWPHPGDLLAAWWLSHRSRNSQWEEFSTPAREILSLPEEPQRRKSA